MKRTLLILAALVSSAFADLPQMSDNKGWLGYFVGWHGKNYDFGIGSDAETILHLKKSRKRAANKSFRIHYLIQEQINGQWVTRKPKKEGGLTSTTGKGLDPKNPVTITIDVNGDTKVEFVHAKAKKGMVVKPKLVEKKTKNPIRVGVEIRMPRMYRIEKGTDEREVKRKIGKDMIIAKRLKDGKKVKYKFLDPSAGINGEKYLKDGASEVEVKSKTFWKYSMVMRQGSEKAGHIEVEPRGPLHGTFKLLWFANMETIGEKDTFVTFSVE